MSVIEKGIVAGNVYDKYGTKNPVARFLMNGFLSCITDLVRQAGPAHIHEVGCGEGMLAMYLSRYVDSIQASDFSVQIIEKAESLATESGSSVEFKTADIYNLDEQADSAEMIVCCEVLEHLEDPERAVESISRMARPWVLASVPREPLWRILNMCRGHFRDTPGHIQHWSRSGFISLLERYLSIVEVRNPVPWTIALCRLDK